jgi:hypothetical protein
MLLLFGASLSPGQALAENWYFEPSVNLRLGYDDNVRFSVNGAEEAFSATVDADASFGFRTEVSNVKFGIRLNSRRYEGLSDLNTDDQFFSLDAAVRTSDLNKFRLEADYSLDSTRTSEVLTTGWVDTSIPRNNISLRPSWERTLTERLNVTLGYRYTNTTYDEGVINRLIDYRYDVVDLGLAYQYSERTSLQGVLAFSMYDAQEIFSRYKSVWAQVGVNHQFSETLSGSFMIGPRYTEFDFTLAGSKQSSSDSGYMAELRLTRRFETFSLGGVLRSFENPSSSGRLLRTQEAELNLQGDYSSRIHYSLQTGIYRNSSTGGLDDASQDRDYFKIEPRIRWRATRWWSVTGSYRYRWQEDTAQNNGAAVSNAVFIGIRYVWPNESVSRWMDL